MSIFATQHYHKIAKVFNSHHPEFTDGVEEAKYVLVMKMCKMLKEDNSRFHETRFIDACFGEDEDV